MKEQPRPTPNKHTPSWFLVTEDLVARGEMEVISDISIRDMQGMKKYGTRLQPHNGRDSIRDAYEEAMDLVVYLKNAVQELPAVVPPDAEYRSLNRVYNTALGLMCALRDYQTWKTHREAVRHDTLVEGHRRLAEAKADRAAKAQKMWPQEVSVPEGVVPGTKWGEHNILDTPGQPQTDPGGFDPSQTHQAHTGHPGASQGHSLAVANIQKVEPVFFLPDDLPKETKEELEAWKAAMDASLEAERKKHAKAQAELASVQGHGHQEWGEHL